MERKEEFLESGLTCHVAQFQSIFDEANWRVERMTKIIAKEKTFETSDAQIPLFAYFIDAISTLLHFQGEKAFVQERYQANYHEMEFARQVFAQDEYLQALRDQKDHELDWMFTHVAIIMIHGFYIGYHELEEGSAVGKAEQVSSRRELHALWRRAYPTLWRVMQDHKKSETKSTKNGRDKAWGEIPLGYLLVKGFPKEHREGNELIFRNGTIAAYCWAAIFRIRITTFIDVEQRMDAVCRHSIIDVDQRIISAWYQKTYEEKPYLSLLSIEKHSEEVQALREELGIPNDMTFTTLGALFERVGRDVDQHIVKMESDLKERGLTLTTHRRLKEQSRLPFARQLQAADWMLSQQKLSYETISVVPFTEVDLEGILLQTLEVFSRTNADPKRYETKQAETLEKIGLFFQQLYLFSLGYLYRSVKKEWIDFQIQRNYGHLEEEKLSQEAVVRELSFSEKYHQLQQEWNEWQQRQTKEQQLYEAATNQREARIRELEKRVALAEQELQAEKDAKFLLEAQLKQVEERALLPKEDDLSREDKRQWLQQQMIGIVSAGGRSIKLIQEAFPHFSFFEEGDYNNTKDLALSGVSFVCVSWKISHAFYFRALQQIDSQHVPRGMFTPYTNQDRMIDELYQVVKEVSKSMENHTK